MCCTWLDTSSGKAREPVVVQDFLHGLAVDHRHDEVHLHRRKQSPTILQVSLECQRVRIPKKTDIVQVHPFVGVWVDVRLSSEPLPVVTTSRVLRTYSRASCRHAPVI